MIIDFQNLTLDIDIEKTKSYYNTAEAVSVCSCQGCRNYEKAVDRLPKEVVSFFSQIGVDIKKAREVYVNNANTDHTIFYAGWYHVCGKLVEKETALVYNDITGYHQAGEKAYVITNDFKVTFSSDCNILDSRFPLPAFQLDILANIPWVLEEDIDCEMFERISFR